MAIIFNRKIRDAGMDNSTANRINQMDIDIRVHGKHKLLAYEASISAQHSSGTAATYDKTALLQINVVKELHHTDKLIATLSLLERKFKAVSILIDMRLAKLTLKIIMPYLKEENVTTMAEKMKAEWLKDNITIIGKLNIPWNIITSTDNELQNSSTTETLDNLIRNSTKFIQHTKSDAKHLASYISNEHRVTGNEYQNSFLAAACIIDSLANVATINNTNSSDYAYISHDTNNTYNFLAENSKLKLPKQHFSLNIIKNNDVNLFITKDHSNKFSYISELDFMTKKGAALEIFAEYFPGSFYIHSLNRTIIGCNRKHALAFGMRDESNIVGKTFDELFSKKDADAIAKIASEVTATCKAKTMIESRTYLGKRHTYLSVNTPLRNKRDTMIGVIGASLAVTDSHDPKEQQKLKTIHEAQAIIQGAIA